MKKEATKPRKSDLTRAAILASAKEHFASYGYQSATIRGIAASAQIDPSMVMRYFGNKDRLFAAAAEIDLHMPDLTNLPREQIGAAFVEHFLQRWEDDEALKALLRSAVANDIAADKLRRIFAAQVTPTIARLVGSSGPDAAHRAGLVASQMLGLAVTRYLLKLPPVVKLSWDELSATIGRTVQSYLFDSAPGN